MQIDRLFQIVYILLSRKSITAGELAKRFGVSVRTIYRDLDTLSANGVPVYATQGKGGGISLMENYVMDKTTISPTEQSQILIALQALSATEVIDTEHLLKKMGSFFHRNDDLSWIEVDFTRWGHRNQDSHKFSKLKNALINKYIINLTYCDSYGKTEMRTIKPAKLVYKSSQWYLQAYCCSREDFRTFKVNRMLEIEVLSEQFDDIFTNLPPIDSEKSVKTDNLIQVELHFPESAAYRIYDEFNNEQITQLHDKSYLVSVELPHSGWLYSYILSFGTEVVVLKPDHLKKNIAIMAQKVADANRT